ncbi:OmpA family protein [Thiohalorhabdus sp.]|uniref:OmpA family protein n=1 Tax=Thiohalorhabdus sp. TaxID=3094134 RepID=UPI002FC2B6CB
MKNRFLQTTAAALTALALVACTTTNPYTGEEQTSKATSGAAIGAATGAVAGMLTGSRSAERALIGAGIGALAGGAVGGYMDRQEAELRRKLEGTGVSVTRHGDNITLNMPGNVTFATDSSDLNPRFFEVLDSVALVLEEYPKTVVHVNGFTDSTGPDDYNQALSERRAESVAAYLRSQGLRSERLVTQGFGERHPVASNETAEGRKQNRRVELTLEPVTQS